jgi:hypothetical protein
MAQSRKYKSFGVRRENNLSDINNSTEALNNLLNNLTGVNPVADPPITFLSEDLDAIRGLRNTSIEVDTFRQLAGTAARETFEPNVGGGSRIISPLIRLEDRFRIFRNVTEEQPVFTSGQGPKAYFIPSDLIPSFDANTTITEALDLTDTRVQEDDDFWMLGEFIISDRIRPDFPDSFGGILWEGYYLPAPNAVTHSFEYETSGLFHIEFDRYSDGNWEVLKSIYAKKRDVIVSEDNTANTQVITLETGETRYLSVGDILFYDNQPDPDRIITNITGDVITISDGYAVSANTVITFDMPLGEDTTTGTYSFDTLFDRAEVPQAKKRIFWWFPDEMEYQPSFKYLRNRIIGRRVYDYFFLNQLPAATEAQSGSIRELLENAVTPSQEALGGPSSYRAFRSTVYTESLYVPVSSLTEIRKADTTISFSASNRAITGSLAATEIGNYIVPNTVSDLDTVVPKNMRIKDLYGNNVTSQNRIVNQPWPESRTGYSVSVIDHRGLIDYFVATSSGNVVTITNGNTERLRKNLICITSTTTSSAFTRITEISGNTTFTTSDDLNLATDSMVYVYANAGILDRSADAFCIDVFGQVLQSQANSGTNTLTLVSVDGVDNGQVVQYGSAIAPNTTVTNVAGNVVTLSANLLSTINADETIVFAPAGTTVSKEVCVLPLDLSPPFLGVDTGLSTDGKNIRSAGIGSFNLKLNDLEIRDNSAVTNYNNETYDSLISVSVPDPEDEQSPVITMSLLAIKVV